MKIILSPAKKMNKDELCGAFGQSIFENGNTLEISKPLYLNKTEEILTWLQSQPKDDLKKLWKCNDKIAKQNYERIDNMDLYHNLTPAVLAYEGIAFQYMSPAVFEDGHFEYVQEHLCILSAFYGALKAMDGVTPYRLEMQAKAGINHTKNLYDFWGPDIYNSVKDESGIIINLASREYSKCVEKYLCSEDRFITINFCEKSGDKLVTKGTYAKMARGDMVRFMAENNIQDPDDIKKYNRMGYTYRADLSSEIEFVFVKDSLNR
ncbi:MAG: peroxide stress protein YaaA [Agathobacter sp.]|nr:peroxide stress protein YaaA [Agathobacter sp.]